MMAEIPLSMMPTFLRLICSSYR
ncbi:similar to hypothetical protein FLJ11526 (predicted) [Rattus norvegicus]|uniref:Uncharacterized protein n=1 Tax=Rattus norvegicus TaxID=10116 RepID=A6HEQ0_RAT|nr:similar to hypothetical protein FLJ11526 (predicted) [Rattus norvegicus]